MAKKIVRITQIYYVDAIMDIAEDESDENVRQRIDSHLNHNGADAVITQGGNIVHEVLLVNPDDYDTDEYECID